MKFFKLMMIALLAKALLNQLEREGFPEEKLRMVQRVMGREDCDLLDVLDYLAYETTPKERAQRVKIVRDEYYQKQSKQQQEFLDFLMTKYVENGEQEFTMTNLPTFLDLKYGTVNDAMKKLNMTVSDIRTQYLEFQKQLYIS